MRQRHVKTLATHRHDDVDESLVASQRHRGVAIVELHDELIAIEFPQRIAEEVRVEKPLEALALLAELKARIDDAG